jgi:hypothetical protein
LLVGERLELAQGQHLALASGQRRVSGLQLLARGSQERRALRIVLEIARLRTPRLGVLRHGFDPSAALDHVVARVAGNREEVCGEIEIASLECGQPLEQPQECLLRGVGRVVRGAEHSHAEAIHAPLVAIVEIGERTPVPGDRKPREFLRIRVIPCVSGSFGRSQRRRGLAFCGVSPRFWPVTKILRHGPPVIRRGHVVEDL